MARTKTKAGDGFPIDVFGKMIGQGDLVLLAQPTETDYIAPLGLGYVENLSKNHADVMFFSEIGEGESLYIEQPHLKLLVVRADDLNSHNPFFEHVKMEAVKNRVY